MKKHFIIMLPFLLLFTLVVPNTSHAASNFKDVTAYKEEINYLTDKGIIKGFPDNTFKPRSSIKRIQAVEMILREKGITDFSAPNPGFTDLDPDDVAYPVVAKAVEMGIISGKTDPDTNEKYFDTYGTLTREQMAKILVIAYGLEGEHSIDFKDVPKSWSHQYVSALAANKITTGYPDRTFKPYNNLSREHFAVFMARLLDNRFINEPELPIKGFKNITIGMSKAEVKKVEKTELFSESDDMLIYRNKNVLDFPADVIYEFENNKLKAINIFHNVLDDALDTGTLESYFVVFYENLSDIYGEADKLDDDWYDDKNGNVLSALWLSNQHDVFLTVKIESDSSSLGGIRITWE